MHKLMMGALAALCVSSTGYAEVVTDGTLGSAVTLPGPDFKIDAALGQQLGANLFHSFSALNLSPSESATFSGPGDVEHIVGRVTGGQASSLQGTLRSTIAGSQLWLLNPAGIDVLGSVEIPGGVTFATATGLRLKDGGLFNAVEPAKSVLSSAPPQTFFLVTTPKQVELDEKDLLSEEGEEGSEWAVQENYQPNYDRLQPELNACKLRKLTNSAISSSAATKAARAAPTTGRPARCRHCPLRAACKQNRPAARHYRPTPGRHCVFTTFTSSRSSIPSAFLTSPGRSIL